MRKKRPPRKRKKTIYVLPNFITTAGMFCGFVAIVSSIQGRFEHAAMAILIATVFDAVDGRIARLTNTTSHFGTQYDSLADLVSFGVAPAVTAYLWALEPYGRFGWLAAFLFTVCGALRLARFNVQKGSIDPSYFVGLPIPAAAFLVAATILLSSEVDLRLTGGQPLLVMMYALSFLMVSNIRYFSFKNLDFLHKKSFNSLVAVILVSVVVAAKPHIMLGVIMFVYVISGPIGLVLHYVRRKKTLHEQADIQGPKEQVEPKNREIFLKKP
jgi:CDP-diacylglycerol--serine O-phosphatidyltransferase